MSCSASACGHPLRPYALDGCPQARRLHSSRLRAPPVKTILLGRVSALSLAAFALPSHLLEGGEFDIIEVQPLGTIHSSRRVRICTEPFTSSPKKAWRFWSCASVFSPASRTCRFCSYSSYSPFGSTFCCFRGGSGTGSNGADRPTGSNGADRPRASGIITNQLSLSHLSISIHYFCAGLFTIRFHLIFQIRFYLLYFTDDLQRRFACSRGALLACVPPRLFARCSAIPYLPPRLLARRYVSVRAACRVRLRSGAPLRCLAFAAPFRSLAQKHPVSCGRFWSLVGWRFRRPVSCRETRRKISCQESVAS